MRRITGFMTMLGVATALLASSFVAAQDYRLNRPQPPVVMGKTVTTTTVVEKAAAPAKVAAPAKGAAMKMRMPVLDVAAGNLEPMIQQFIPQGRPLIRAEIHIAMSVCEPTKDQREKINREGERILKEVATKYAEAQMRMNQGQWRGGTMLEPRKMAVEGIEMALKPILTPEQMSRYREEIAKRDVDRKQVAVRSLVARLDQILVLSSDQRAKLVETLMANWNDSWGHSLEQFLTSYDERYLPMVPDQAVIPILNDLQKKVYQGTQKISANFFGNFGFHGGMMIEEEAATIEARAEPDRAVPKQEVQKQQIKK